MSVQRLCRGIARKATGGAWAIFTHHRCANCTFIYLISRRRLRLPGGAPGATCELGIEPVSLPVLNASACTQHCGFHTLSNLFMPCNAQFFSITLSAVCLENFVDELVGMTQKPHSHWVRARVVSTASFFAAFYGPLSMLSV